MAVDGDRGHFPDFRGAARGVVDPADIPAVAGVGIRVRAHGEPVGADHRALRLQHGKPDAGAAEHPLRLRPDLRIAADVLPFASIR